MGRVIRWLRLLALTVAGVWGAATQAVIPGDAPAAPARAVAAIRESTLLFQGVAGTLCTATVVGARALLTAAHCVTASEPVQARLGDRTFSLRCGAVGPEGVRRFDVALCVSDQLLEGVRAARIDAVRRLGIGDGLVLAGFGCTAGGGVDRSGTGALSSGLARVVALDVVLSGAPDEAPFIVAKGASPCFGDAGGGVYHMGAAEQTPAAVSGLLSRGDLASSSYIVSLASVPLIDALRQAADQQGARLCGVHDDGASCAQAVVMQAIADMPRHLQLSLPGMASPMPTRRVEGQVVRAAGKGAESVAEAFQRVCGLSLAEVPGVDAERIRSADQTRAKSGEVLELPSCPSGVAKAPAAPEVKTIQPGDTVWSIWKNVRVQTPLSNPAGKGEFAAYAKVFEHANPGVVAAQLKPNVVVKIPPLPGAPAPVLAPVVNVTAPPQASPILALSSAEAATACGPGEARPGYPYDLSVLLEVLALNRRQDSIPPSTVVVLVADSGLQGAGEGIFANSVLLRRLGEDAESFRRSIVPLVLEPSAFGHGTAVASVALGGPLFARMGVAQGAPRIQLAVQRIYFTPSGAVQPAGGVTADVSRFDSLISLMQGQNASVVNLSLRSTVPISAIEVNLGSGGSGGTGRTLFVAAAGNQGLKLSPDIALDTEAAYPALYGGGARDRLITVMALRPDGTRASFSNWGERFVDIAAPGCDVPALAWRSDLGRFSEITASGTSLAAPLVTFAAALVQSESSGRLQPRDVKRRLLASADLSPAEPLRREVADGRRLNIAKAAAVRVDVVQVGDELRFGDALFMDGPSVLADDGVMRLNCERDSDTRVLKRNLHKIARWKPQDGVLRYLVYSSSDRGEIMSRDVCEAPKDLALWLRQPSGDTERIDWAALQDLVMRN